MAQHEDHLYLGDWRHAIKRAPAFVPLHDRDGTLVPATRPYPAERYTASHRPTQVPYGLNVAMIRGTQKLKLRQMAPEIAQHWVHTPRLPAQRFPFHLTGRKTMYPGDGARPTPELDEQLGGGFIVATRGVPPGRRAAVLNR